DLDQITDLVNHAAHIRAVLEFTDTVELAQARATHGRAVRLLRANRAANQLDFHGLLCRHRHGSCQTKRSSTDLPRLAATAPGVVEFVSASNVARTML